MELKKAFERGLSRFVRRRHPAEPSEEGPGPGPIANHPRRPKHSTAMPADDSSPEESHSKGLLSCSPLPMAFRREPIAPSAPLKDKISIFEGLVKSSPPSPLGCQQGDSNTVPTFTGDKTPGRRPNEPTSRLPNKIRSALTAAEGSTGSWHLRPGRRGLGNGNNQHIGEAGPPSFLRRLSLTIKHKHKPSLHHSSDASNSRANSRAEEERAQHSSREPHSTTKSQKQPQSETRQKLAADSLRKRLESELRSGASANGHRDIQGDQPADGEQPRDPLTESQSHRQDEQPSLADFRRKTTLWDIENPFDVPKAQNRSRSDATGGRLNTTGDKYSGHRESNDFSSVALARVPSIHGATHQRASASRYVRVTQVLQPQKMLCSNRKDSASGQAEDDSDQSGSSGCVVVANAECELTHPRPSRSSDKKMIKVLCKCGRETGEEQDNGDREGLVSVSEGSSASFHTAPGSTSVG